MMKKTIISLLITTLALTVGAQCPDSVNYNAGTFTFYYSTMPNSGNVDAMSIRSSGTTRWVNIVSITSNTIVFTQSSLDSNSFVKKIVYWFNCNKVGNKCENTTLPVTWLGVEATTKGKKIMVEWSTSMELDNSHFIIEKYFPHGWDSIGTMKGRGTVWVTTIYNYWDDQPLEGWNVYRVKQVDYNGDFEYSKEFAVRWNNIKDENGEDVIDIFKYYNILGQKH